MMCLLMWFRLSPCSCCHMTGCPAPWSPTLLIFHKYWPRRRPQNSFKAAGVVFSKSAQNAQELVQAFLCLLVLQSDLG